jgi:hypothetical protein
MALHAKAITVQPEWRPSCFIVDNAIHERNAIKIRNILVRLSFFFD